MVKFNTNLILGYFLKIMINNKIQFLIDSWWNIKKKFKKENDKRKGKKNKKILQGTNNFPTSLLTRNKVKIEINLFKIRIRNSMMHLNFILIYILGLVRKTLER